MSDVTGVRTLEVDLQAKTVRVTGSMHSGPVRDAITAAGYTTATRIDAGSRTEAELGANPMDMSINPDGNNTGHKHTLDTTATGSEASDTFPTDPTGLPEATRPAVLELADGDTLNLRIGPVAKRLDGMIVRMLGYNGSIPGPTFKVRQGSEVTVQVTNDGDLDTTVHWHGLRLDNKYDGVPHETQTPIPVGGNFSYRLRFPDPGLYWYHPHIREDYTQEMGLYGNILVLPAEPDYWPPAHREVVLTLDDVLMDDGKIAPFSPSTVTHTAMGRFGNVLLVGGQSDQALTAAVGEVVRLWLTNTANSRVFNVCLPGARMKLVGGDSGRVEREEFVSEVLIGPSERAVVDVLLEERGQLTLQHRTPDRIYPLASITVTEERTTPPLPRGFDDLRQAPELVAEREQWDAWLDAPPDKIVALVAEMDDLAAAPGGGSIAYACPMHPEVIKDQPGRCPKCGMKLLPAQSDTSSDEHDMAAMPHAHHVDDAHGNAPAGTKHDASHDAHAQGSGHGEGSTEGIEWEDDMVAVNRQTTTENMRWRLVDRTPGADSAEIDWRFVEGDRVKIRLVNEMESDHPMHHPFHIHGAGRFLVLARNDVTEPNLVWKDTVVVRTGETIDILFDVTNPGVWMAHCHIPEHMQSGMMFSFTVARRPS
jgi:FtsP/CotA-like multicopper oxidase with cupredoxin domain